METSPAEIVAEESHADVAESTPVDNELRLQAPVAGAPETDAPNNLEAESPMPNGMEAGDNGTALADMATSPPLDSSEAAVPSTTLAAEEVPRQVSSSTTAQAANATTPAENDAMSKQKAVDELKAAILKAAAAPMAKRSEVEALLTLCMVIRGLAKANPVFEELVKVLPRIGEAHLAPLMGVRRPAPKQVADAKAAPTPMSIHKAQGRVKSYNTKKGFGFIDMPGFGRDIFVYNSHLIGRLGLVAGEAVEFDLIFDDGRPQARQVKVTSGAANKVVPLTNSDNPLYAMKQAMAQPTPMTSFRDMALAMAAAAAEVPTTLPATSLARTKPVRQQVQDKTPDEVLFEKIREAQASAASDKRRPLQKDAMPNSDYQRGRRFTDWQAPGQSNAYTAVPPAAVRSSPPAPTPMPQQQQQQQQPVQQSPLPPSTDTEGKPADEGKFANGSKIVVVNFYMKEVNGSVGLVKSYDATTARYCVAVGMKKKDSNDEQEVLQLQLKEEFLETEDAFREGRSQRVARSGSPAEGHIPQPTAIMMQNNAPQGSALRKSASEALKRFNNLAIAGPPNAYPPCMRMPPQAAMAAAAASMGKGVFGGRPYSPPVNQGAPAGGYPPQRPQAGQPSPGMGPDMQGMGASISPQRERIPSPKGPAHKPPPATRSPPPGMNRSEAIQRFKAASPPRGKPQGCPQLPKDRARSPLLPDRVSPARPPGREAAVENQQKAGGRGPGVQELGAEREGKRSRTPGSRQPMAAPPQQAGSTPWMGPGTGPTGTAPRPPMGGGVRPSGAPSPTGTPLEHWAKISPGGTPQQAGAAGRVPGQQAPQPQQGQQQQLGMQQQQNQQQKIRPVHAPPEGFKGQSWRVRQSTEFIDVIVRETKEVSSKELRRVLPGEVCIQRGTTVELPAGLVRMPVEPDGWVTVHARLISGPTFLEEVPPAAPPPAPADAGRVSPPLVRPVTINSTTPSKAPPPAPVGAVRPPAGMPAVPVPLIRSGGGASPSRERPYPEGTQIWSMLRQNAEGQAGWAGPHYTREEMLRVRHMLVKSFSFARTPIIRMLHIHNMEVGSTRERRHRERERRDRVDDIREASGRRIHKSSSPTHMGAQRASRMSPPRVPSSKVSPPRGSNQRVSPHRNSPSRTSPARTSPPRHAQVSPSRAAPAARVSPARNSPPRVSPSRSSPSRVSPSRTSPGRTSAVPRGSSPTFTPAVAALLSSSSGGERVRTSSARRPATGSVSRDVPLPSLEVAGSTSANAPPPGFLGDPKKEGDSKANCPTQ